VKTGLFGRSFKKAGSKGSKGVRLVISDAHEGLKAAIKKILTGSAWQRCRVHFMRNVLSQVPKHYQGMVSSIIRTIFAQNDQESAREQLRHVVDELKKRFPKAMKILEEAEEEILAYMAFPREHWAQIHSTNPLERLNGKFAVERMLFAYFQIVRR